MLVLMFSTAGVPPFVGFWAKLWIIQALLGSGHIWAAVFAVVDIGGRGVLLLARGLVHVFRAAGDRPPVAARWRMRLILFSIRWRWRRWGCCRTRCSTSARGCFPLLIP
jgi:NADH-quinone oxidoreductase subunit N